MTAFAKHGDCQVCSVFLVYCWFHWVMVTIQFTKNACIQERGKHKLASLLKRNAASHMKKCPSTPAPSPRPFNNYYRCFGLGVNEEQAISLVISAWRAHSTTNTLWFTGIQKDKHKEIVFINHVNFLPLPAEFAFATSTKRSKNSVVWSPCTRAKETL